jgi:RNA-directed DNA polymerase
MKKGAIEQCWLYAIASPKDLARRLSTNGLVVSAADLNELAADVGNFKVFPKRTNGKVRMVQQPRPRLQRVHRRIHDLLSRIETPDYLHSAIAGHSYITNAAVHGAAVPSIKIDVKKFFQSVPTAAVFCFFAGPMRCNIEVAGLLAKLLTYQGHLPTGGSASPIIAFYAFKEMFDEIECLARARCLTMSCYVDDMTLSGQRASRSALHQVRLIIAHHGLQSHKVRFLPANRPKVITGVVITAEGLRVPNRRHRAISQGFIEYQAATDEESATKVLNKLIGRMHEAGQIEPQWKARAAALERERRRATRK